MPSSVVAIAVWVRSYGSLLVAAYKGVIHMYVYTYIVHTYICTSSLFAWVGRT